MDRNELKVNINYIVKSIAISALAAFVLEITLFNFRHYQSLGYNNIDNVTTTLLGLEKENGRYKSNNEGDIGIEMTFPPQKVRNIYLDFERVVPDQYVGDALDITIMVSDESNSPYYEVCNQMINFKNVSSRYLTLHLIGKVSKLKIKLNYVYDTELLINRIALNVEKPFNISVMRFIMSFSIFLFIAFFCINSKLYLYSFKRHNRFQKVVLILYAILQITFLIYMCNQAKNNNDPYDIYAELARVFANGQVYLDVEPDSKLSAISNPYDLMLRTQNNISYLWDHAYYNGKYYVYFGITPALLFYLPYYTITGSDFPGYFAVYICCALTVIGIILLMSCLVDRYYKDISFLLVLLLIIATINGIGLWYLIMYPRFYSIPILTSLTGLIWGIYFWLTSINNEQLVLWRVALGSFLIASIAGGRVQMLMSGFLAMPILSSVLIRKPLRDGIGKKWFASIIAFALPLVLVSIGIMYYNYIRFGSIADFGANYNLTTNDMTNRGFVFDRIGLGIFTYLFQTPNTVATFPFLYKCKLSTGYMGKTISENMYGGLITCNLILGVIFNIRSVKKELKNKGLFFAVILLIVSGMTILVADTQMAGILQRYMGDFAIFFFGAAVIILFVLYEKMETIEQKKVMYKIVVTLCVYSDHRTLSARTFRPSLTEDETHPHGD